MKGNRTLLIAISMLTLAVSARATETPPPQPYQVLISIPDQRLAVVRDGELVARYPISTSRFGTGDNFGSYRTPLGELRVCDKIGENLAPGAVIHHRSATGEVLQPNAPGRDPIVTRVIWLDGLEAQNHNAHARGIYIHGTPEERTIGTPASYGCIRMRSKDVIKVFEQIPVGTLVSILPDKLPHLHRYEPAKEQAVAENTIPLSAEPAQAPVTVKPVAKSKPAPAPAFVSEVPPTHSDINALRAMKGSILLANLPGGPTAEEHHKATQ